MTAVSGALQKAWIDKRVVSAIKRFQDENSHSMSEPQADGQEPKDETKIPADVEAEIAVRWSDNMAAAQLTRTVARALVKQGFSTEQVREKIANSGRVVD